METKTGCVLPSMKEGGAGGAASTHRNAEETIAARLLGIASQHPFSANENLGLKVRKLTFCSCLIEFRIT